MVLLSFLFNCTTENVKFALKLQIILLSGPGPEIQIPTLILMHCLHSDSMSRGINSEVSR